jgi:hypothetical protein
MATRRCSAITRGGERCTRNATESSEYCFSHDPARADERRANARKGGLRGGNGRPKSGGMDDTQQAIKHAKALVGRLLSGDVDRSIATACFQGLNALARLVELERKLIEQDEILERIEALERRQGIRQQNWPGGQRRQ